MKKKLEKNGTVVVQEKWEEIHQNCLAKMEKIVTFFEEKEKNIEQLKSDLQNATQKAKDVLGRMKILQIPPQGLPKSKKKSKKKMPSVEVPRKKENLTSRKA